VLEKPSMSRIRPERHPPRQDERLRIGRERAGSAPSLQGGPGGIPESASSGVYRSPEGPNLAPDAMKCDTSQPSRDLVNSDLCLPLVARTQWRRMCAFCHTSILRPPPLAGIILPARVDRIKRRRSLLGKTAPLLLLAGDAHPFDVRSPPGASTLLPERNGNPSHKCPRPFACGLDLINRCQPGSR